ncbi:MAG: hypothetical protein OXC46_07905, partial [Thaumarchaeota archaeon]|nr:hypothetical protein [Nitrososphaerota archaeon]
MAVRKGTARKDMAKKNTARSNTTGNGIAGSGIAKKNTTRNTHPSLDIVDSYGTELSGKKTVLCVAGSVAAY